MASVTPLPLAPEALDGIQVEQAALDQQAARLKATGDPAAEIFAAMAVAMKASNRLIVDATLKAEANAKTFSAMIEEGCKPLTSEELRTMGDELHQWLVEHWTQVNRTAVTIGIAAMIGFGAVCGTAGWYLKGQSRPWLA